MAASNTTPTNGSTRTPEAPPSTAASPPGTWATPADRQLMLRDAELAKALHAVIRKKIQPADRDDVQSLTLAAIWKAEYIPLEPARKTPYCCGIARRTAKRWLEKERRRLDFGAESLDARDEPVHADPAVDLEGRLAASMRLAELERRVKESEKRALAWLLRNATGVTYDEIAGEEDIPNKTVESAVLRLRDRLGERFRQLVVLLLSLSALPIIFHDQLRPMAQVSASPYGQLTLAFAKEIAFFVLSGLVFAGLAYARRASRWNVVGALVGTLCFAALAVSTRDGMDLDPELLVSLGHALLFGGTVSLVVVTRKPPRGWAGLLAAVVLSAGAGIVLDGVLARLLGPVELMPLWLPLGEKVTNWGTMAFAAIAVGRWLGRSRPSPAVLSGS